MNYVTLIAKLLKPDRDKKKPTAIDALVTSIKRAEKKLK
jgi:hypothetical protein